MRPRSLQMDICFPHPLSGVKSEPENPSEKKGRRLAHKIISVRVRHLFKYRSKEQIAAEPATGYEFQPSPTHRREGFGNHIPGKPHHTTRTDLQCRFPYSINPFRFKLLIWMSTSYMLFIATSVVRLRIRIPSHVHLSLLLRFSIACIPSVLPGCRASLRPCISLNRCAPRASGLSQCHINLQRVLEDVVPHGFEEYYSRSLLMMDRS